MEENYPLNSTEDNLTQPSKNGITSDYDDIENTVPGDTTRSTLPNEDGSQSRPQNNSSSSASRPKKRQKVRAFQCNQCSWRSYGRLELELHKRTHTGERPYKCDKCDQTFTQSAHLSLHRKKHLTGTKKFRCEVCSYTLFTL